MKCPECGVEKKKDIERRCCCGYQFIFDGKNAQGMTDAKFSNLLRRAGGNGRFYFTFPQLYSAWCQQDAEERICLLRKRIAGVGVFLLTLCTSCFLLFGWIGVVLSLTLLVGPWLLIWQYRQQQLPDLGGLKKLLKQWQAEHGGGGEMLLIRPSLHEPPLDFSEKDLLDYGVERVIIVERPLLVDLLVKNGFHADQNALIFSRDGYPAYIVQRAQELLKERSLLPIYLLHDASETGMAMSEKNRLPGRAVIDLGIRPEHLEKMHFLNALQLQKNGYKAPLDILPYPVLATICGEAVRENSTLLEVLEQWDTQRV